MRMWNRKNKALAAVLISLAVAVAFFAGMALGTTTVVVVASPPLYYFNSTVINPPKPPDVVINPTNITLNGSGTLLVRDWRALTVPLQLGDEVCWSVSASEPITFLIFDHFGTIVPPVHTEYGAWLKGCLTVPNAGDWDFYFSTASSTGGVFITYSFTIYQR